MSKKIRWLIGSFFVLTGFVVLYVFFLIKDLPRPSQFGNRQISQSTKIYDRTGEILLYEVHGEEKRTIVSLEEIPEFVRLATLAAEDAYFYSQPAFNWKAILRAIVTNIQTGQFSQGGSTITQQLAKNLFLTPEKTLNRKIKEIILAIELESKYSKDEILNLYLNQIPYGSNAYGVEAASQTYFGKSVKNINLAEAAILTALLKAPSYYSPWGTHQDELFERQENIIKRMVDLGFINQSQAKEAVQQTPRIRFAPPVGGIIKAPHFVLTVKEMLVNRYGEDVVERGGLKVITTLDWKIQEAAEKSVAEGAARNESLYQGRNAALVAQDPKTGQVLALVGSRDYYTNQNLPTGCIAGVNCGFEPKFNVATQGLRQPGSALKPFVYLAAFTKGYSPKTVVFDVPTEFVSNDPDCPAIITSFSEKNPKCFNPDNFDGIFRGPVSLEAGLAQSINIPSVKTLYLAGPNDVLKILADFGISTLKETWRYGLSLVLGGGEVKLIELINAYATLAQEGVKHEQKFILKVEDAKGQILESYQDETKRVIEPQYPRLINQILSDVDLRRGLFQNSLNLTVFPDHEVALKTGTTNDYRDAWAIGYTPFLVAGVWAGNNDNSQMQQRGSSILAAVPIWNNFMKNVISYFRPETFTRPEPISLPNKPMLNGNYLYLPIVKGEVWPQIHNILYYVDKKNPLGPPPVDPYQDPQFYNWETAVVEWSKFNIPFFSSLNYNRPLTEPLNFEPYQIQLSPQQQLTEQIPISIQIKNVKNGDFVVSPFRLEADIKFLNGPAVIELNFNRSLVDRKQAGGGFYSYSYRFGALNPQNLIELKVVDRLGNTREESLIVFH